jgi:hypothetical protein
VLSVTVAIETGEDYQVLPGFRDRVRLGRHIGILNYRVTEIKTRDHRASGAVSSAVNYLLTVGGRPS